MRLFLKDFLPHLHIILPINDATRETDVKCKQIEDSPFKVEPFIEVQKLPTPVYPRFERSLGYDFKWDPVIPQITNSIIDGGEGERGI